MNKKISLGLALALVFISVAATVAITMSLTMRTYNAIIKDLPSRSKLYSAVSELDDIVRNNYYGEINDSLLNAELSGGYAEGLGDKYSRYLSAADYSTYKDEMDGKKIGIGVIAFYNPADMSIYVAEVSENSPAAISGLQKGDKITHIDEEAVTVYNYTELLKKLTGDRLSTVTVTFVRGEESKTVSVVKGYSAQSVYYSLNGGVGYVKITDFYATTATQLNDAVNSLVKQGATSLVFDLRGTYNGLITHAASALDVLVPVASEGTGALATATAKDGSVRQTFTADAESVSMPMIVLVNSETAGPAELFACDLRDYGKAQLVGEKTAGNGTMQEAFALSDGGAILLTTAVIQPYISDAYNKVGLTPDTEVPLSSEKRVKELHLTELSTYGLMNRVPRSEIREMISALENQGYLATHPDRGDLKLTSKAREVLFHGEKVKMLVRKKKPEKPRKKDASSSPNTAGLLEDLKTLRMTLAKEEKIPAYIVFSNATLQDMARKAPVTMTDFLDVSGVGKYKAERYGQVFITTIKKYLGGASGEGE